MKQSAYRKLNKDITDEIAELIHTSGMNAKGNLADIQPTSRLSRLAAQAAANVLIEFERGREVGWDERKIYVSQKE